MHIFICSVSTSLQNSLINQEQTALLDFFFSKSNLSPSVKQLALKSPSTDQCLHVFTHADRSVQLFLLSEGKQHFLFPTSIKAKYGTETISGVEHLPCSLYLFG